MAKLVDSQQLKFMQRLQIMDVALIANEVVDSKQTLKKQGILCKLDIEKYMIMSTRDFLLGF